MLLLLVVIWVLIGVVCGSRCGCGGIGMLRCVDECTGR